MKRLSRLLVVVLAAGLTVPMLESPALAAPPVPVLTSPANGSSVSANPVLAWAASAGATIYHLQVATTAGFTAGTVQVDVNTVNTNYVHHIDLPQGSLYWRVQASDAGGTSAYSATGNFTKTAPVAPNLTSPVNSAVLAYPSQPLIFTWDPMVGAGYYHIEMALDSLFSSMVPGFPAATYNPSYTLTNPPTFGQTFYWRVRGFSLQNLPSQYSAVREFSVTWADTPTLLTPPNTTSPAVENPELSWNWHPGATSYDLQVSTDINFNSLVVDTNVRGTRYARYPHLVAASYFWRVRGRIGNTIGPWSEVWTFQKAWPGSPFATTGAASRVQLLAPADGAAVAEPTLRWTPFRNASHYEVQLSGDPTFTTYINCYTNHPEVTINPGCLESAAPDTIYYWRVRPIDGPNNVLGLFSPLNGSNLPQTFVWRPTRVTQTAPANGASVDQPLLKWNHVPGGRYRLTVVRDDPAKTVVASVDTFNTSWMVQIAHDAVTPANNNYRWYVQTTWNSGSSLAPDPSTWRSFTIGPPGPTFSNPDPIGSPQTGTITPPLSWQRVTGAFSYNLYYNNGGWILLAGGLAHPGYTHSNTDIPIGTFAWKVEARDASNVLISQSSVNGQFTITPPGVVNGQTGPAHCSDVGLCSTLPDTPIFEWTPADGTTYYQLILATDANFTNITQVYNTYQARYTPLTAYPDSQAGQATYWFVKACQSSHCGFGPEVYSGSHPPISAFRKQSKEVKTISPGDLMPDPQNPPSNPPTVANQVRFEWEDYLATNTTPACSPVDPPVTVCANQEALVYQLEISDLADFTHIIETVTVDDTFYTSPSITYPEGPLYWRVRAIDQTGNNLTRSIPRMLKKLSSAPTPTAPANNAQLNTIPVLQWNALDYAASYEIEVYKNPSQPLSPSNLVLHPYTTMTAWSTPQILTPGDYGWRIRRYDAGNNPGPWSAADNTGLRRFTYTGAGTNLASPANGAVIGTNSLLFQWQAVAGAASYQIQTSAQSNFSSLIEQVNTVATAYAPTTAYSDNTYYWRVITLDTSGQPLGTSAVRNFIRGIPPLSEPLNVTGVPGDSQVTVSWDAPLFTGGTPITGYTVTSSPGNATCTTTGSRSCVVPLLLNGTSYTFTVRAKTATNPAGPISLPSSPVVPVGAPNAPTSVTATAGDGEATIAWTAPSNNGGAALTTYTVTSTPGNRTCTATHPTTTCKVTGLTNGTSYTFVVKAKNANNATGPNSSPSNAVSPTSADYFHALDPARIQDSRPAGPQVGPYGTPWAQGQTRDVQVTNMGNVPPSADAVVLNVTITNATKSSFLTIFPAGQPRPNASSLNWVPGQTIPNAVTVKLGTGGKISVYNPGGNVDVIMDVVGYYDTNTGDGFTSLSPARIQDSRPAGPQVGPYGTPWGAQVTRDVQVTGEGGVPDTGVSAVVLNVTVTNTTAPGFLSIWPAGQAQPLVSSLNWVPGQTIPNAVTVKLGAGGKISVFNPGGNVDVIMDVVGYFAPSSGMLFHALAPSRIQDSRPPAIGQSGAWGSGATKNVVVAGASVVPNNGVPSNAGAVLLNVTVTGGTAGSFLTIWPTGQAQPLASSLNWVAGLTIPNAVTVKVGTSQRASFFNAGGSVHVIADVGGYYV